MEIDQDIYQSGTIITADTGFANEVNMTYLYEEKIDGYLPDNQFRRRDPRFSGQKKKYGKRHPEIKAARPQIPASEFAFDPKALRCICPSGQEISYRGTRKDEQGNQKAMFEGKLSQCKSCDMKVQCMKNPESANHRKGNGRQVSFLLNGVRRATYTDWMKHRIDSAKGKEIYGHRMSVVEPVFGNIGTNKRLNRFSLRGKKKVQGQWNLYCLVHNIEKLANYGNMVA